MPGGTMYVSAGGGSGKMFAAIGVDCPAGATLTCSNGKKTLKGKSTGEQWVFAVPEAGTWLITSDDGENVYSTSVSVSTEGEFIKVSLSSNLILFDAGDNYSVTGGWDYAETKQQPYTEASSTKFNVGTTLKYESGKDYDIWGTSIYPRKATVYNKQAIDVSDYKTLTVVSTIAGATLRVGTTQTGGVEASVTLAAGTNNLDISALSGDRYISIYNNASDSTYYNIEISKMVLSR